jgi:hypothetical protein
MGINFTRMQSLTPKDVSDNLFDGGVEVIFSSFELVEELFKRVEEEFVTSSLMIDSE